MNGSILTLLICLATIVLHILLPARNVVGYVCNNNGQVASYRLNGSLVHLIISFSFYFLLPIEYQLLLYNDYYTSLITANVIGLAGSFYFLFRNHPPEKYARCVTIDQVCLGEVKKDLPLSAEYLESIGKSKEAKVPILTQFFLGRQWNPRFGSSFDVKMWLYLIGAVLLQCNILSCVRMNQLQNNDNVISIPMKVYVGCFTWFLVEYLWCEEVHLYTYDIFAERVGFKLTWGCLVFYPFFYCIGAFPLVYSTASISSVTAIAIIMVFFIGWIITRGSNLQKFVTRMNPASSTGNHGIILGFFPISILPPPITLPNSKILISGFWGIARHFNYMGEIIQAIALSIPACLAGHQSMWYLALLYPLYYIALFVPRQIDDEEVCRRKYGAVWQEYEKRVKWRICPGIW